MIAEGLKMKVADYKEKHIPLKIILATYGEGGCPHLQEDFKGKYDLDYLMKEFQVQPTTIKGLAKGMNMFH